MLLKILNYFRGSVRIEITGAAVERLLNICAAHDIPFWDVVRVSPESVRASVSTDGFFRLRRWAGKSMCRIRVCGKRGLPFKTRRLFCRYALWAGALLCAACIWVLSGFIWTIEVRGCERMSQLEVLSMLAENGLCTGARTAAIDTVQLRNTVLLQTDRLAYISVNVRGTHAEVTVREKGEAPDMVPQDEPCDIVADRAGVIARLRVMNGTSKVQVGQVIMPGDVIAEGTMVSTQGEVRYVHASAEADVRTWHTYTCKMPAEAQRLDKTGKSKKRYALIIGKRRINLYFIENAPFACYYKSERKEHFTVNENFRFPIAWVTELYEEAETVPCEVDAELAAAFMEERMKSAWESVEAKTEVVSCSFELAESAGAYVGIMKAECIETTGTEVPIGKNGEYGTND